MTRPNALVQGTLDLMILRVLTLEPMHGWAIAQRIRLMSDAQLQVGQSALYPALHRLEYYTLTARGRRALETESEQWARLSAAVNLVMKPL